MSFGAAEACWVLPEISPVAVLCCSSAERGDIYSLILPAAVTASRATDATLAETAWDFLRP
jgi:hypothetical protein